MNFTVFDLSGSSYIFKDIIDTSHFINVFEDVTSIPFSEVLLFNNNEHITETYDILDNKLKQETLIFIHNIKKPVRVIDELVVKTPFGNIDLDRMEKIFGRVENWDVSFITNMDEWFHDCTDFNRDISNWNVSRVKSMKKMFKNCKTFNQPIGKWKVKK